MPTPTKRGGAEDPVRLEHISITELFGRRNLEIDTTGPCAVLTGGNGTGKSTILKLVYAISNGDFGIMAKAPVSRFALTFSSIGEVALTRNGAHASLSIGGGESFELPSDFHELQGLPRWAVEAYLENNHDPEETQRHLISYLEPRMVEDTELRNARSWLAHQSFSRQGKRFEVASWYNDLRARFTTLYINDQRLILEQADGRRQPHRAAAPRPQSTRAVEAVSRSIQEQMTSADTDYARRSQRLDREFPQAVLNAITGEGKATAGQIADLAASVTRRRTHLKQVGLLDADAASDVPVLESDDPSVRAVVAASLRNTDSKLNVLMGLADRLTTLKGFIDRRLEDKTLVLQRDRGVVIRTDSGDDLDPQQLSSGEQQLLVIAHEVLFKTTPLTLVMIDEPEVSLHLRWQVGLVEELVKMGRPSQLQFLMATHAPALLTGRPDMERSLDRAGIDR